MTMKTLVLGFSLTALLASVACTEKGKPYYPNEGARPSPVEQPASVQDNEQIAPDSQALQWKVNFTHSQAPVRDVLLPLARRVLDLRRVLDPKSLNSRSVMDELIVLNDMILGASQNQRRQPEFATVLKLYQTALTVECGEFRDSCRGFQYLKISGTSWRVVKLLAQNDDAHRFRLLLFALQLKDRFWDSELAEMIYTSPAQNLSATEASDRERAQHLLQTTLREIQNKTTNPQEARRFLDTVHAWSLSQQDPASAGALLTMMAQAGYLYAADGSSLHPELKTLLARSEQEEDSLIGQQRLLQKQNVFHPELIGATFTAHFDELTFIVDSVFRGRLSPQDGALLYGSSRQTLAQLQTAVENYFRVRFLVALYKSSLEIKKVFNADVQGPELMTYVVNHSSSVTRVWNVFKSSTQPLKTFSQLASHQRDGGEATAQKLFDLFGATDRSITVTSTYPHTMALFHLLSQNRFQMYMPSLGRKVDTGDLMTLLFNGHIKPLLPYSEDTEPLTLFQMIYAFDMAVRTNLFELLGIDTDFFMADTLRRISGKTLDAIAAEMETVGNRFKKTADYQRFKEACAEFTTGQLRPRTLYVGELIVSPYYGNLLHNSLSMLHPGLVGMASGREGDLDSQPFSGLMYLDRDYAEAVEQTRLDLGTQLRFGEAMLAAYTNYLHHTGATNATIAQKTRLTRGILEGFRQKRVDVLARGREWHKDLGGCFWPALVRDAEVQMQVLDMEREYLRQVYRDIVTLRAGASPDVRNAIQAGHRFKGLPSGFTGFDRISRDGYTYTRIDFILRMADYVKKLAPQVTIDFGQSLNLDSELVYRSSVKDTARTPSVMLYFTESEEEFVNNGIKAIFNTVGAGMGYTEWFMRAKNLVRGVRFSVRSLATLYRLERELNGRVDYFTPQLVLREQEMFYKITALSPKERQLLTSIRMKEKFDQVFFKDMVLNTDKENSITDLWGLYDYPLTVLQREELGDTLDDKAADEVEAQLTFSMPMTAAGQLYYQTRGNKSRGTSVIPYNSELDRQLDLSVQTFVRGEMSGIAEAQKVILNYAAQVGQRPPQDRPRADVNLYLTIQTPISDTVLPRYTSALHVFNRNTQNCFVSATTCADFQ
jgi:hypothetical protein